MAIELPALQKGSPERLRAAAQIRTIRRIEKSSEESGFVTDRTLAHYIETIGGFSATADYLSQVGLHKVLGIGEGTTHGIHELSTSNLGTPFDFYATVLVYDESYIQRYLGSGRTFATSAERMTLPGVKQHEIGLMLASTSIAYSAAPLLVAHSMDTYLAPGGIIKASFAPHRQRADVRDYCERTGYKTADEMAAILSKAPFNYDIATADNGICSFLLAVKPGLRPPGVARELLRADARDQVFSGHIYPNTF